MHGTAINLYFYRYTFSWGQFQECTLLYIYIYIYCSYGNQHFFLVNSFLIDCQLTWFGTHPYCEICKSRVQTLRGILTFLHVPTLFQSMFCELLSQTDSNTTFRYLIINKMSECVFIIHKTLDFILASFIWTFSL